MYTGDRLGDPYVTILGVTFWDKIEQTMKDSWARLTGKVRAQAKRAYTRGPCLATRMRYVNTFSCPKSGILRKSCRSQTKQLTTTITWYIWRGTVFRVPVSTLQRPKQMGNWEMLDNEAKCTTLLLYRMYLQGQRNGSVTAACLQFWNLTGRQANPPHATKFPTKLAYLYVFAVNMAYITTPEQDESPRCFRQRIYAALHSMALALKGVGLRDVRVMTQHPTTAWSKVWGNLHAVWSSEELKAAWFRVIHDLIPTND